MKPLRTLALAAGFAAAALAIAADPQPLLHRSTGVVKAVDPSGATVTIFHEPVPSLAWPAMSMTFALRERWLGAALAPGQRVAFDFVAEGDRYVLTGIGSPFAPQAANAGELPAAPRSSVIGASGSASAGMGMMDRIGGMMSGAMGGMMGRSGGGMGCM